MFIIMKVMKNLYSLQMRIDNLYWIRHFFERSLYWLSAFRLFWCFSQSYDLLFGLREEKSLFVYGCFFILNHMIFSLVSGRRRGKLWRRKSIQRRCFLLFLIFFSHLFPLLTKSYFLFPYSLLLPPSLDCLPFLLLLLLLLRLILSQVRFYTRTCQQLRAQLDGIVATKEK